MSTRAFAVAAAAVTMLFAGGSLAETVTFSVTVTQRYECIDELCGFDGSFVPTTFLLQWEVPDVSGGQAVGPVTEIQPDLVTTRASWERGYPGWFFGSTPFSAEIDALQSGTGTNVNSGFANFGGTDFYNDWSDTSGQSDLGFRLTGISTERSEYTPPPVDGSSYLYQSRLRLLRETPLQGPADVLALDGPTVLSRVLDPEATFAFTQFGLDLAEQHVGGVFVGYAKYDSVEYTGTATVLRDPVAMLDALLAKVQGLPPGKSLAGKIVEAQTYYAVPDLVSTCAVLHGFADLVRAQTGKKLTIEVAETLTADVAAIMAAIGCE